MFGKELVALREEERQNAPKLRVESRDVPRAVALEQVDQLERRRRHVARKRAEQTSTPLCC